MSSNPFTTYLETYRLRTGFSRSELAFLLGAMDGKTITRHERGKRLPMLRTALAYGLVLEASVEDLYEGLVVEVHDAMRTRARGLRSQIRRRKWAKANQRKIEILARLADGGDSSH